MMALCNLAGFESPRNRIVKEGGFSSIENYMYEQHELLRRASVQAINNLVFNDQVVKMFEGKNDRTKYLLLLGSSEDLDLAKAAVGSLAILTAVSKRVCKKLFEVHSYCIMNFLVPLWFFPLINFFVNPQSTQWKEIICFLLTHQDKDLSLRGSTVVNNVVCQSKDLAERFLEPEVLQCLNVISQIGNLFNTIMFCKHNCD